MVELLLEILTLDFFLFVIICEANHDSFITTTAAYNIILINTLFQCFT